MNFRHLRSRIIVFFAALLALMQLAAFVVVDVSSSKIALQKTERELDVGERIFQRLLEQNRERLSQAARVLAADFGFREAVATKDVDTMISVLGNHGGRIGANVMMLVSLDGAVIADTVHPETMNKRFEFQALLNAAREAR